MAPARGSRTDFLRCRITDNDDQNLIDSSTPAFVSGGLQIGTTCEDGPSRQPDVNSVDSRFISHYEI